MKGKAAPKDRKTTRIATTIAGAQITTEATEFRKQTDQSGFLPK